jgi:hypothetical protein
MTGEMSWIRPYGKDSNGDIYYIQAHVARALRCRLRPFDRYIGPYIAHEKGKLFISCDEEGYLGVVCLWPGGVPPAYCVPIMAEFFPANDATAALAAARSALKEARRLR